MTAAHLDAILNRSGRQFAEISVVESPATVDAAICESTLANFNHVLAVMGIDQTDFMRHTNATFKQSTKFINWLHKDGHVFHHPFSLDRAGSVDRVAQRWLRSNRSIPFVNTFSVQAGLCELGLAPQMLGRWDFGPPLPYGYHLSSAAVAEFLGKASLARGIKPIVSSVCDIDWAATGSIVSVGIDAGLALEADLYVDCIGDAVEKRKDKPVSALKDYAHWLPCNQVLTMQVPYETHYPGSINPFTTITAMSAGWIRDVPLRNSRVLSYVYCDAFLSYEKAEAELKKFEGAHADGLPTQRASFRATCRPNAWIGNCISIGKAAGTMDPLVATDFYMVNFAAAMLAEHFPLGDEFAPLAYRFNRIMRNRYHENVDFANLHYCLSRRTDTDFWMEMQKPDRMTDRLRAKLAYWRQKPPSRSDFEDQFFPNQPGEPFGGDGLAGDGRPPIDTGGLWGYENYEALLYGMDFLAEECDRWFGTDRPDPEVPISVTERLGMAPRKLPSHSTLLKQVFNMPDYTVTRAESR